MLPPLVERELRIALHRDVRKEWQWATWTAAGVTLLSLLTIGFTHPLSAGRSLFHCLFALGCLGVVTRGFGLTADLFSEERRSGTLGLLVLTGLRPLEIFTHKLLGALWLAFYSLLGALPFFALPFLTGGVLPLEFLCALAFLANALLFFISLGLLASVLHSEGGQAHLTGSVLAAFLCLATPSASWIAREIGGSGGLHEGWLALSPAYATYLVFTSFSSGSPALFWTCSSFTLACSLTALLLAAAILNRTWRDCPKDSSSRNWPWRGRNRSKPSAFAQARRLGRNPFGWMVARRRGQVLLSRVLVASMALLWFGGWLLRGPQWVNPGMGLVGATLLHAGLIWILACAAGRQLAEDRQTGGLEVLLTTPLSVEWLLDGQLRALGRPFRETFVAVLALDAAFFCGSFTFGQWSISGLITYVCLWGLLLLVSFAFYREALSRGLWISVWTGRPVYAATQATWPKLFVLAVVSIVAREWVAQLVRSGEAAAVIVFLCLMIGMPLAAASFNRTSVYWTKLSKELRLIAAAPIPARGDRRFAKWVPELIHPPGRWGELELKPGRTTRPWSFRSLLSRRWRTEAASLPTGRRQKRL